MDWRLHKSVFELRFPQNFHMWDSAGALAESLSRAVPALELAESNPSKVQLNHSQTGFSVSFQTNSLLLSSGTYPKIKDGFASDCELLTRLILEALKVKNLTRIGNRIKFSKRFQTPEAASKAIENYTAANGLTIDRFCNANEFLGRKKSKDFRIRFEDAGGGITIQLRAASIEAEIDAQYRVLFPNAQKEAFYFAEADFDFFTNGPLDVESCSPGEIVQSNVKMIETLILPKLAIG